MLELRVDRAEQSARLVLLGSLERTDLPHIYEPFEFLADVGVLRIVIVKLWRMNPDCFQILHKAVLRARERGQTCLWCGPLPQAQALLGKADESRHIVEADNDDLAAAAWTVD